MTKQEEIREVIDLYTDDTCLYLDKDCAWYSKEGYCASGNDSYTCLMKRLTELGVVIKVDRELPQDIIFHDHGEVKRIHYVAVESLIKKD